MKTMKNQNSKIALLKEFRTPVPQGAGPAAPQARASDAVESLRKGRELSPDAVLLDVKMTGGDDWAGMESPDSGGSSVKVLVLSLRDNRELVGRVKELLQAIEPAVASAASLPQEAVRTPFNQRTCGGNRDAIAQLTSREREILALIAEGLRNKEIASHLGVGVRTVETLRERLMRRLRIYSVAGLTRIAIASGLVSLEGGDTLQPAEIVRPLRTGAAAI